MGEPKRIAVTQIGTVKPVEKKDKRQLCHRFTLSLVRSTEKTCPEFSYNDLLKNTVDADGDVSGDENDPFAEQDKGEHDKLEAIARSFEEKYAPVKQKKKKHKYNRIQEFVDLGDGYDDADPFIDNTEAYDELVPSCLTTQHGGFYINSGKLDFRAVSDSEDDFQSVTKKRFSKKNIITSDNESESLPKKRGPKKFKDEDEIRKKKRKKLSSDDMDKSMIKRRKFEREGFRGLKLKKRKLNNINELLGMPTPSPSSTIPGVMNGSQCEVTKDKNDGRMLSAAALQNMESAIDSVISQSRNMGSISSDDDSQNMSRKLHSSQDLNEEEKIKLPEHLPLVIPDLITKLKQAACDSEMGKKKFFNARVNQMLLQIENASRQLPPGIRNAIYGHLATYLPCSKETLIKRAKKLQLEQNDDKLREPFARLKEVINKTMPALIDKHQAELQAVQQMKRERKLEVRENGSTESDDEVEKPDADKQKRIMAPRRKFEWTPDVRNLLNQIVQIKLNHYELSKIRSQTPEDYLKTFFEQELKPLWPQGWMQSRMLFKESRAVHQCWTNPSLKPRRPLTITTGMRMTSPVTTNGKPSTPVSLSTTVLSSLASSMSFPSGANTTLVPSVHQKCGSLSSSAGSSDTSSSSGSSPTYLTKPTLDSSTGAAEEKKFLPMMSSQSAFSRDPNMSNTLTFDPTSSLMTKSFPSSSLQDINDSMAMSNQLTVAVRNTVDSTGTSVDKHLEPVAGKQSVTSTSKPHPTEVGMAAHLSDLSTHQTSVVKSGLAANSISTASLGIQKSANSVSSCRSTVTDNDNRTSSSQGIKTGSKPNLAAALQGVYLSTMTSSAPKATHQSSHSIMAKTQDSHVALKDTSQGFNTAANQSQKQTSSSSSSNNSNLFGVASTRCQVKLSDVLLTHQKSQPKHQVNYQGTGLAATSQESQMAPASQVKISSDGRTQKRAAAVSSQSSTCRIGAQAGSLGLGKKFQISPTDMSIIRAGLAQAATQMVLKAQEKQITSSGPKQAGADQQTNQTASKRTSPIGQQLDVSGLRRTSPLSKENTLVQHTQKSVTVVSQTKQSSPVMQQDGPTQPAEKSKKAASGNVGHLPSVIPRGHSVQVNVSPVAHSTVAETGLFAVPCMPVTTSTRTVAVNQVSSTSGMGNNRSAHSSSQTLGKASINMHMTSQSQSIHSASSGIDSRRHISHSQPSSQSAVTLSPVLQQSASQRTSPSYSTATTRVATSPAGAMRHPVSVSVTTYKQTSYQSSSSHVTSSSHGTANRTSPLSLATKQNPVPSQTVSSRMPSTSQHVSTTKLQQSNVTSNNLLQPNPTMQQPQLAATSRAQPSQTMYGKQSVLSSQAQKLQSTTSSRVHQLSSAVGAHAQQSQPVASVCNLASYSQMLSLHSRPDSTSSAAKSTEPKFGGLTLSQIQAQTLKASQKAHIQTAQQYSSPPPSTSTLYRSPEGSSLYGIAQLRSPSQTSHGLPGYSNISPSSHNHHQSPDPSNSANSNPYSMLRTTPSLGHHNTSPAHKSSQNRY